MEFVEDLLGEEIEDWGSPATNMIAGAIAGVVEHCGMFPFDTIKVSVLVSLARVAHLSFVAFPLSVSLSLCLSVSVSLSLCLSDSGM
jgi:Mitochondrial carrier protein